MSSKNTISAASQDEIDPPEKGDRVKPDTTTTETGLSCNGESSSADHDIPASAGQDEASPSELPIHIPSTLTPEEHHQRLQQAARILANGAIRATLKQRAQQNDQTLKKTPVRKKSPKKIPPLYVLNSDTSLPSDHGNLGTLAYVTTLGGPESASPDHQIPLIWEWTASVTGGLWSAVHVAVVTPSNAPQMRKVEH